MIHDDDNTEISDIVDQKKRLKKDNRYYWNSSDMFEEKEKHRSSYF